MKGPLEINLKEIIKLLKYNGPIFIRSVSAQDCSSQKTVFITTLDTVV